MIQIDKDAGKTDVFAQIKEWLSKSGLAVVAEDDKRPWGGFFVIDEGQITEFKNRFFPEVSLSASQLQNKLSPKILLVAPHKRLSWQYHFRRAELWKLIAGVGAIVRSETDEEAEQQPLVTGDVVRLVQGERHRLVGADGWGVVAEIWMHTDPAKPSDEDDIVRVQDDFQRK